MCLGEGIIGIEGGSMNEYVWIRMRDGYSARGEGSIESWRLYSGTLYSMRISASWEVGTCIIVGGFGTSMYKYVMGVGILYYSM